MNDRASGGLTLLEVVLALAVLAILGATFTTVVLGNLRHTSTSGQRTQAAQVLNYLGRRVAGGDAPVLPQPGETLRWDYGDLNAAFPDIANSDGVAAPRLYRAEVASTGSLALAGASVIQYDLSVCYRNAGTSETCVRGTTFGPPPAGGEGADPPLPGIN